MTFAEKFEELKEKYGAVDENKLTEQFAVQVNMTDDDAEGTFYVAYMNGNFEIAPYDYRDHTAMITVSVENLEKILSKKASPVPLFLTGSLKVDGNVDHALKLVELMAKEEKKAVKKAPVRKKAEDTAEKTEEPKPKKRTVKKTASEKKTEK